MCNAWNHHPGCTCGFGGDSVLTEEEIARTRIVGTKTRWAHEDDFCRQTICPKCGNSVYFLRHNGGAVWLDELGPPWPKHGCFGAIGFQRKLRNIPSDVLGIVVETEVLDPGKLGRVVVKCHDGSLIDLNFETKLDLVRLVGALVAVRRDEAGLLLLSLVME